MKEQPSEKICKQFGDLISAYFDGQLAEAQMNEVENHLRDCPLCARQLEQYRLIKNLINLEKQNSPVDLNATVMANMEREQLLSGLDELAKPPTPAWTRLLRTLAAAAMIGLVVYAGFLVVQYAGNNTRQPAPRQAPEPKFAQNTSKEFYYKGKAKPPLILGTDNSAAIPPSTLAKARKAPSVTAGLPSSTLEPKPVTVEKGLTARKNQPAQPLVLQPFDSTRDLSQKTDLQKREESYMGSCEDTAEIEPRGVALKRLSGIQSLEARIPPALKFRLWAPDLPSWMLLKEQLLEILKENNIPNILDPEQVSADLKAGKEFFYQARKGLDLAPGAACSEFLIVVNSEQFQKIHHHLQQSALDTIRQDMQPELKKVLTTQPLSPELAGMEIQTIHNLEHYFGRKVFGTGGLNKPTTTTAASAPATRTKTLLPILITIEMPPRTPTTTTTAVTTPATQTPKPASASQPTTRKTTTTQP